jgi:hypothetical protein
MAPRMRKMMSNLDMYRCVLKKKGFFTYDAHWGTAVVCRPRDGVDSSCGPSFETFTHCLHSFIFITL